MRQGRSWEIYNAEGAELSFQDLNREASEFWSVPLVEVCGQYRPATPKTTVFSDLYFALIEPITCCKEGLVKYEDLVGMMVANSSGDIKINPRSFKMLIDKLAPYIRLLRQWQDKGYKIYSTRYDLTDVELDECSVKCLTKKWADECPPSYAQFGDIQDFNPYL